MSTPDRQALALQIDALKASVDGLRLEVEGWREHVGSTSHFILVALENMSRELEQLVAQMRRT